MELNLKNIIFVWGDLGAGSNFIKNSILLHNYCHFPVRTEKYKDRLSYLNNEIYPLELSLSEWMSKEYILRNFVSNYGYDFTLGNYKGEDLQDLLNDNCKELLKTQKVVFTIHEFNSVIALRNRYNNIKIFFVRPITDFSFCWQIRAYNNKLPIESMHNFTFKDDIKKQREEFIALHGDDIYIRENLKNMMEIMKQRLDDWITWSNNNNIVQINLEDVIYNKNNYIENIYKEIQLVVELEKHNKLYDAWIRLHWPVDETLMWKYFDTHLFKKLKINLFTC